MISIEPYNHFKSLRNRHMEWGLGRNIIPAKSIIEKIIFEVDISSEAWNDSDFRNIKTAPSPYCAPDYLQTCIITNPSPDDFDKIMRMGNDVREIRFEFKDKKQVCAFPRVTLPYVITQEEKGKKALQELKEKIQEGNCEDLPRRFQTRIKGLLNEIEACLNSSSAP